MERWIIDGDSSLEAPPRNHVWQSAKKGGFYKNTTVKQAKTGKCYITIDGDLVQDVWLNTLDEAKKKASEYVEYL